MIRFSIRGDFKFTKVTKMGKKSTLVNLLSIFLLRLSMLFYVLDTEVSLSESGQSPSSIRRYAILWSVRYSSRNRTIRSYCRDTTTPNL